MIDSNRKMRYDDDMIHELSENVFSWKGLRIHTVRVSDDYIRGSIPMHRHAADSLELHVILGGRGSVRTPAGTFPLQAGSFFLTHGEAEHEQRSDADDPMRELCFYATYETGRAKTDALSALAHPFRVAAANEDILLCARQAAKELSGCPENVFTFADCVKIFIQRLASEASGGAGNPGDIRLLDWIDIFWSPNPHVVLSDMNDGIVPLAEPQTFLLSDSSRKILGLRNSESRRSRDAYMLWALKRSRSEPGRKLSIIVPRKNIDSDPLMPSPILMCEADLPGRVKMLFKDLPSGSRNAHFLPLWKFSAKKTPYSRPFSPSALKTYISSPWVFYLKYVLKAEIFDSEKEEMDAAQFGTLFHSVMESFAKSAVADSTDWAEIFSFMSERLDALSKAEFGRSQRMQVRMQIENLRNRLGSVARVQARRRAEGWKISETEVPFEFSEGGRRFAGRIDRIDVRENSENSPEYAVLDYKTADKVSPDYVEREHLSNKGEWKNLQLPLYVRAAADIYPGRKISCGYFLVPKDLSQTGVQMWDNFSGELLDSAMEKALEMALRMKSAGVPVNTIAEWSGLTEEEINRLEEDQEE